MGKKSQSFGSFADAAAALKNFKAKLTKSQPEKAAASAKPDASRSAGFADIEAAMMKKAEEITARVTSRARRQEFAIQKTGRRQSAAVPVEKDRPESHQIKAGLLPKRPPEERPAPPPAPPVEVRARPAAQAAATSSPQSPAEPACAELKERPPPPPKPGATNPKPGSQPVAHQPANVAAAPPSAPPPPTTKQLLNRIQTLFEEAPPPIEARPRRALPWVRSAVEECVARGAEVFRATPKPGQTGYIIGCDFGTSSIKIAVRQPYQADNPTAARPAPTLLQSNRHPYLWQSVVWYSPETEAFSLLPGKGRIALEGFKAGILAGGGGKRVLPDLPVTRNEAAAAFLAMQLAHCLGWYDKSQPLGANAAKQFLAINIGIPVAANDDTKTYRDFRHIVSTARALIAEAPALTLSKVRGCYQASTPDLPAGFDLVPELTAAISGYANEPFAKDGAHILIDVGASTLDVVAFILHGNKTRVSAFAADVGLLGAAALDAARTDGLPDKLFRLACVEHYDGVFNYARHDHVAPRDFDAARRQPKSVQLIAIGGGCKTSVHKEVIQRIDKTLGDFKLVNPCPPPRMTDAKCDASRLLLAYGLTSDIPEQLELRRPSEIPRIDDQHSAPIAFISKDDV